MQYLPTSQEHQFWCHRRLRQSWTSSSFFYLFLLNFHSCMKICNQYHIPVYFCHIQMVISSLMFLKLVFFQKLERKYFCSTALVCNLEQICRTLVSLEICFEDMMSCRQCLEHSFLASMELMISMVVQASSLVIPNSSFS